MYAELRIDVLLPQHSQSFQDIDNKLKTLCDALQLPKKDPGGLHCVNCLLEDDNLIYKLDVDTEYLLGKKLLNLDRLETMWIINVSIKGNRFHKSTWT